MHIIGLLLGRVADRRLVADFLQASGYLVRACAPAEVDLLDWMDVSMVIADTASAQQHAAGLAVLKRRTPDIILPMLAALSWTAPSAIWLASGFDDVLRLPLSKSELTARVDAFLRVRDQSLERSRAYAALAASEERFRAIFEQTAAGMAIADRDGRLVQVNPALCRFLGYSAHELLHENLGEITHPDDRAETARLWDEVRSGQRSSFDIEKRYIGKGGSMHWARVAAVFQFDAAQQPEQCIAIIQDITPRKLAEAERDQVSENLQASGERLRLVTRQVVMAQEEERKRLSRDLHDELGQSLAVLKISLRLIESDLPETAADLRQRMQAASDLTDATIEQMRQLGRDLRPVALDELGLYAALETLCRTFARRTQLVIHFNTGGEEPVLSGETEIGLYRFVQEALTNVVKHAHAHKVRVSIDANEDEVRLSVGDDGQGFELPSFSSTLGASAGIGLMGMRERIDLLGGKLEIASQPGSGTRLVVTLPVGGTI